MPPPASWAARLRSAAKVLSAYFTAQTTSQLLGMAAGLLLVRLLPVDEFALYTLAGSVLTFFTFLTDLGSTGSLVFFAREARQEGQALGSYVAAVVSLRLRALVAGALVVGVTLPLLARAEGFGWTRSVPTVLAVIAAVAFQIAAAVRVLVLRLEDRYGPSYRAEVAGAALRLAATAGVVGLITRSAWAGLATAALGSALTAWAAGRAGGAPTPPAVDLAPFRRRVLRYLRPTLPSALYFALQAPLTVWLAALFAGTRNIAEVGALGRLGLLLGLFSSLIQVVFLPRLARVTEDRRYFVHYLEFGAILAAVAGVLMAAGLLMPGPLLAILGPQYQGLEHEVALVALGASLTLLGSYAVAVNLARSWTRFQTAAVLVLVAAQAAGAAVLPLSTTAGVLGFSILTAAVGLTTQLAVNLLGFFRPRWVLWPS
jgi:O-antigen/teichoic acid export membrane protein